METIKRSEQKLENTWDLTQIYKKENDFYKDVELVEEKIKQYDKYKGHILDNSENLYKVLQLDTDIMVLLDKLGTYSYRLLDQDIANTDAQKLKGKVELLFSEAGSKSSYIVPEILEGKYEIVCDYIKENKKLEDYKIQLDRIFVFKSHTLSDKEEKLLCEFSNVLNTPSKTAGIIRNSELPFGKIKDEEGNEVTVGNENYNVLIKSTDRRVRKDAFESLYASYSAFKDTFTETMQSNVMYNVKNAKIRNYDNAKQASLYRNYVNELPYDNLINTINDNLHVIYKYYDLKKEISKLEDYSLYDTYINLCEDYDRKYTYEEAKNIVFEVLSVFGKNYLNNIKRAFDERWIDIYPNKGKRGGAYSSGGYLTNPYILLNYQGTFHDVSTLIHELGHSMHTLYSCKNNLPQYADYKIFVAEVASTVNEMLLNFYMLEHSNSKEEKLAILSEMMDNFKATLYRQTMFSEFEEFMHDEVEKGTILTSDVLCDKYYELNKKYFGDNVIINDEIRYEWMRIPHFYYNFYVYQYATGLSCACYIVNRILNKEENAIEDYMKFLSCGNSLDPIEALKLAKVDITKKEIIQSAIDMFDKLIDEYRELS